MVQNSPAEPAGPEASAGRNESSSYSYYVGCPVALRGKRAYDGFEARGSGPRPPNQKERDMAKKASESGVYRVTEIIGTSPVSWENAAKNAVETAAKSLRDLRVAEVSKLDMKIEGGKVVAYRARVSLSFKYDA